jgi:hypothetical protein
MIEIIPKKMYNGITKLTVLLGKTALEVRGKLNTIGIREQ